MITGTVRVATVTPPVYIGNVAKNKWKIEQLIKAHPDAHIVVFPELSLTGYTCGDLFAQKKLIDTAWDAYIHMRAMPEQLAIVGLPVMHNGNLYNCAGVLDQNGPIGVVPKSYLPNYREFYESRWFVSAGDELVLLTNGLDDDIPFGTDLLFTDIDEQQYSVGIEICEDAWAPLPPSTFQALAGATILVNISASNEIVGKADYRRMLVESHSGRLCAAYVYCSSGPTESSSDLVFGGHCLIGENGKILAESDRFQRGVVHTIADIDVEKLLHERSTMPQTFGECAKRHNKRFRTVIGDCGGKLESNDIICRTVDSTPFVPHGPEARKDRCAEVISIQSCGVAQRLKSLRGTSQANIGVSGGLDSTLALLATVNAFESIGLPVANIHGITMPGFGTSNGTKSNAIGLMTALGISQETIDIRQSAFETMLAMGHKPFGIELVGMNLDQFERLLADLPPDSEDLVFENVQARLRTLLLMSKGFVIGTGDLSELALGWCTYNGDHMSMYNANCGVPKTLVRHLIEYMADNWIGMTGVSPILRSILDTEVSPELLPLKDGEIVQKTEDILGPYIVHDFFLYHFVRNGFTPRKILELAQIAFPMHEKEQLREWLRTFLRRFFANQFKRNCVPDGPKVGSVSLSPRGDWRMPSDADVSEWMRDIDRLPNAVFSE